MDFSNIVNTSNSGDEKLINKIGNNYFSYIFNISSKEAQNQRLSMIKTISSIEQPGTMIRRKKILGKFHPCNRLFYIRTILFYMKSKNIFIVVKSKNNKFLEVEKIIEAKNKKSALNCAVTNFLKRVSH